MRSSHCIYKDVPGSPFRIGQRVRVTAITDETADIELLGTEGIVTYFEYDCGCGQTFPKDPMIGVFFGTKIEEFWKEELKVTLEYFEQAYISHTL